MSLRLSHGGVGQKVDPDSVGPLAVLGDGFLLVADPVQVPPVDGRRVVNSKDVDGPHFKVGVFELRGGSEMSTGGTGGTQRTRSDVLTRARTQLRAQEASAPGKMYLFMLFKVRSSR